MVLQAETPVPEDLALFLFRASTGLKNLQDTGLQQITGWNF